MESIDARQLALNTWLNDSQVLQQSPMFALVNDASFRRYFRVFTQERTFIAMDAPPAKENCVAFVAIAESLRRDGVETPQIFAKDLTQGFLLLSDFGDLSYLKALNTENADYLYQRALHALAKIADCQQVTGYKLPYFTAEFMLQEWAWHKEWFLQKFLNLELSSELDSVYQLLIDMAVQQPQVFMHRDYHAGNLMVLKDGVGILDFQDAFIGPVTYDLVSLLRDCYIDWPEERVQQWVAFYWHLLQELGVLQIDLPTFIHWFDWMGVQRHLKALLTFARKKVRDNAPGYLKHMPRTMSYLLTVTKRYSELTPLYQYLHTKVQPALERELLTCVR